MKNLSSNKTLQATYGGDVIRGICGLGNAWGVFSIFKGQITKSAVFDADSQETTVSEARTATIYKNEG
jgi:hypothetical protein